MRFRKRGGPVKRPIWYWPTAVNKRGTMTSLSTRARRAVRFAALALQWERTARVVWPTIAFPTAYVILALFGVWDALADPWRAIALATTVFATSLFFVIGVISLPWPRARDARRRVEQDSELAHRPFEALHDRPANADLQAQAIWQAHQERMRHELEKARARRPRAAYAALDRYGLRAVLLVGLVAGFVVGQGQIGDRLSDAFALERLSRTAEITQVDAWITPPNYTGQPPIFLGKSTEPGAPVAAPAGSELVVRVTGANRRPNATLEGEPSRKRLRFERDGPGAYQAKAVLENDATIHLRRPQDRDWVALVSPDAPPVARITDDFDQSPRQELMVNFFAEDDYAGLTAFLRVKRLDTGEQLDLELPAPAQGVETNVARLDLVKHPWAGLEVEAQILARDAMGQEGLSEMRVTTLPTKLFLNPLAEAIAHERMVLLRDDTPYADRDFIPGAGARWAGDGPFIDLGMTRFDGAPASVKRVHSALELLQMGANRFGGDYSVHAALSYAGQTLERASDRSELAGLDEVLWSAAIKADGGELASARRAFEAAQRALAEALARGASAEELERRVRVFREAADRYMEMLLAEAILNENFAEGGGAGGMGGGMQSTDDLQEMLDALEDLSVTGSTEDARRLLQALSDRITNMEIQLNTGGGGGGGSPPIPLEDAETQEAIGDLSEVIGEQRGLADDTQQQALDGEPEPGGENGEEENGGGGGLAERQQELADRLGGLRDQLEESGEQSLAEDLARAEQAMREAARNLRLGDEPGAATDQSEALDALRNAAESYAAEQLAERLGNLEDLSPEELERLSEQLGVDPSTLEGDLSELGELARPSDPLGRSLRGSQNLLDNGSNVDIPDGLDIERARGILEELRKRAGENQRDEDELDYIQRLLELF